jgi:hypothetical protein
VYTISVLLIIVDSDIILEIVLVIIVVDMDITSFFVFKVLNSSNYYLKK